LGTGHYDNAAMESFWGTLKTELVHHQEYQTKEQARRSIFKYIECWYNRKRRRSAIGYMSPEPFEASLS
jgi:putative transposase